MNKRIRRDGVRQVGGGPPTGRGSPGRSASGEWLWARMLVKTPVFRTGSHEKGFGLVMLGRRHRCEPRLTAPSGTSAKASRWQAWMILLRVLKVVDFQCDEREERFASAMLGYEHYDLNRGACIWCAAAETRLMAGSSAYWIELRSEATGEHKVPRQVFARP